MKKALIIIPIIFFALLFFIWKSTSIGRSDLGEVPEWPTPPPRPDISKESEITPKPWPTTPPLPQELTEEGALEQALYFDSMGVQWDIPWSTDTLNADPDRVAVELYSSRSEADKAIGYDVEYAPDLEKDAGRVWVVSIKGVANASAMMPHMDDNELVGEVVYFVSARTGQLLGMHTGPPLNK